MDKNVNQILQSAEQYHPCLPYGFLNDGAEPRQRADAASAETTAFERSIEEIMKEAGRWIGSAKRLCRAFDLLSNQPDVVEVHT
ncbi:hypothetical protein HZB02_06730 [Candidatus Woesearchaeota archaeon]|nr:hypothetical protein [Candidatus Woesearchaeota archaeon]